jgi:hypothetical protein
VYRLDSSFQTLDAIVELVFWRPNENPDWELDRVDGVSVGEKYEFMFRSPGDMLPLPGNWVCTESAGSAGNRGRPLVWGTEPVLPPVADRVLRLVLEAFRLMGNSEW